jgi:hypothetical protein
MASWPANEHATKWAKWDLTGNCRETERNRNRGDKQEVNGVPLRVGMDFLLARRGGENGPGQKDQKVQQRKRERERERGEAAVR